MVERQRTTDADQLVAGIAHDINSPLASVIANLDFATEDLAALSTTARVAPEIAEAVSDARVAAERIRLMVRDLQICVLAGQRPRVPLDVRLVIEASLQAVGTVLRGEVARVDKFFGAVPPVVASEALLVQVFLHLVVNALQALPAAMAQQAAVRISTSCDADGKVRISVANPGPGMSSSVQSSLFTPYATHETGGATNCLSLFRCRQVITSYGGELSVESDVETGTTFHVVLPAAALT